MKNENLDLCSAKKKNRFSLQIFLPIIVICAILMSTTVFSTESKDTKTEDSKLEKTGVHNYLGTDGKWHYVITYKNSKTGAEKSLEWVNSKGPRTYNTRTLPNCSTIAGGDNESVSKKMPKKTKK